MKKKFLFTTLLTIILIILIWVVAFTAYQQHVRSVLSKYPPAIQNWIDVDFFFPSWYSRVALIASAILVSLWIAVGFLKLIQCVHKAKVKPAIAILTITLLIAFAFNAFVVEATRWNSWNYIDVLCIGDEEFMANPDWVETVEQTLETVNNDRFAVFKIKFWIRGWLDWGSNDSENNIFNLYQEAMQECGLPIEWIEQDAEHAFWAFINGSEWNGWWIDLLLIFTGQDVDSRGLSIPTCNAIIMRYDSVNLRILTHELGHQYYLEHCDWFWCVMHQNGLGDDFCDACKGQLMDKRDKWQTDPTLYFVFNPDEGEYIQPEGETVSSWWSHSDYVIIKRYKFGTTISVEIKPKSEHVFDYFYCREAPPLFMIPYGSPDPTEMEIYTNQFTMPCNDTWTIYAHFTSPSVKGPYYTWDAMEYWLLILLNRSIRLISLY